MSRLQMQYTCHHALHLSLCSSYNLAKGLLIILTVKGGLSKRQSGKGGFMFNGN